MEVKDVDGKLVRGITVTWSVSSGGGSVSAATTTTDGTGRAQVRWTLGTTAGENRLRAAVTGVAPTTAAATGQAGAAAGMAVVSGDGQDGIVSGTLPEPLILRVTDAFGNSIAGVAVTFTADAGNVDPVAVTTTMNGRAVSTWTLGPAAGPQTVHASASGVSGAPLRFTANAASLDNVIPLENDIPISDVGASQGVDSYYRITVPPGAVRLSITTVGGTGDLDMFVRRSALPTTARFDCVSGSPTTTEACVMQAPAAGEWFVLLNAYSTYSGAELRAHYILPGSLGVSVTGIPQGANAAISITGPDNYIGSATGSTTLTGLVPGTYTITSANILHEDVVYTADPGNQQLTVAGGATTDAGVGYSAATGGLNLDITGLYITQAVQRTDGTVPLVAGRDGLLRVFARSNAVNTETPAVRVRFYQNGTLLETHTIPAPASAVPIANDEGVLTSTWNLRLPASLIQPGLSVLADVDPTNAVAEASESDNLYPASATPLTLDVRTAAVLEARLVPILQSANDSLGDVTAANAASYTTLAQALYPLASMDVDVRAAYTFTGALPSQYDSLWSRLLNELRLLRIGDASSRYYYGVIKPAYRSGGTGLGYVGHPVAVGVDWAVENWRSETLAHEWGHNFGRRHVDCGNPAGPDPAYPYTDRPGQIGHHGFDLRTNTIRSKDTHHDLMSYCHPTWSSDYTYEAVLDFRAAEQSAGQVAQPSLLVWGRVSDDGVVLEPSFEVVTRPVLPSGGGRYNVTGT
ncbi:MAG: pre-peptidase C-terminal domain-containing protein, partial [Longimicrobiales bacterium]